MIQKAIEWLEAVCAIDILAAVKHNTTAIVTHVGERRADALSVLANVRRVTFTTVDGVATSVIDR